MSFDSEPTGTGWPYIEWMEAEVCKHAGPGATARVLVLGAAGHTFGIHDGPAPCTTETVFVDIDPASRRIAAELLEGEPPGTSVTMDARTLLATLEPDELFDAVVADAYTHGRSMPAHLTTREFIADARRALRPGGRLYVNVIVDRAGADRVWESRFRRTIHSVFQWCRTGYPPETRRAGDPSRGEAINTIEVCERSGADGDRTIYSDNVNRGPLDRMGNRTPRP